MNSRWLICIDDTDNPDSIGTGKLARWLGTHMVEQGVLEAEFSVTRHQLLVHPDIPYTSHNSSACIEARSDTDRARLMGVARNFLVEHWHEDANPGLCVVPAGAVPAALLEIAQTAKREVLKLEEFDDAIRDMDLGVWSAGETGQGRIGACSGAALRSTGEDGRFIGLRGIRQLAGRVSVAEICARSGVEEVRLGDGTTLDDSALIDTGDWVRPSLIGGRAVFIVRNDADRLVPAERRSKDD